MKPMWPLAVAGSWQRVVTAICLVVALLWAGTALPARAGMWVGISAAAVAVLLIVVTWRRAPLSSLLGARLSRRDATSRELAPIHEHRPRWMGGAAAWRVAGLEVISVVAVDGVAHSPSVLDHHRVESASALPVAVVAAALHQFDVALSGIDILGVGQRVASTAHHHHASAYSANVGDHAAVGQRRTWCVLRMNIADNAAAIARRDSVADTVAACAHRLAADLTARNCPARVVGAAELPGVDALVGTGIQQPTRPRWGHLAHAAGTITSYWVSPADISSETISRLWMPETEHTATVVQLRPARGGATEIGVLVRYSTAAPLREAPLTGLNLLSGRQDLAVAAGRADAGTGQLVRVAHRRLSAAEQLAVPAAATGIIVGFTAKGLPLLVNLAAADATKTSTVTVAGELAFLMQLGMRAAATGHQVIVVTTRPAPWSQAASPGLRVLTQLPASLPAAGRPVMAIYDYGVDGGSAGGRAAITMRAVGAGSASVADVHFEQDSRRTAVIRTADLRYRVRIDLGTERNLIEARRRGRAA